MKICLLTTNCILFDDRIYYKIARSLKKIGTIFIINPKVSSMEKNGISIIGNDIKIAKHSNTYVLNKTNIHNSDAFKLFDFIAKVLTHSSNLTIKPLNKGDVENVLRNFFNFTFLCYLTKDGHAF